MYDKCTTFTGLPMTFIILKMKYICISKDNNQTYQKRIQICHLRSVESERIKNTKLLLKFCDIHI